MRIGELSEAIGVDVETIRYYEKVGLMPPPARQANGYRAYGRKHLERLAFIRHCRALDMPLNDVQQLLDFSTDAAADCGDVDRLIDEHLARVHARLVSLSALERQLQALRKQCGAQQHTVATCGILHELVSAAQGERCVCHAVPVVGVKSSRRSAKRL
jgi:Cd(II)/Pb(II)-responsive transcriptional regulator